MRSITSIFVRFVLFVVRLSRRATDGPSSQHEAGHVANGRAAARASLAPPSTRTHRTDDAGARIPSRTPNAGIPSRPHDNWAPFINPHRNPRLRFPTPRKGAVSPRAADASQPRASAFSPPPPFGEVCQTRGAGPQRPAARQSQTLAAAAPDDSPILVLGPGGLFVTEWTPIRPISPILGATHAQAE